jgi:phage gpG-like protein
VSVPETQFPIVGAALGRFGTEFGGFIDLYGAWVPGYDPDDAAYRLMRVGGYLNNIGSPLAQAREIARHDTQQRFDTETDPDGEPWAKLKNQGDRDKFSYWDYKVNAQGYPDKILHRKGELVKGATSEEAWLIVSDALIFDPKALPLDDGFNYGAFHQRGGEGKTVTFSDNTSITTDEMPARPFIGLSYEAVAEIEGVFTNWFADYIEVFDAPTPRLTGFNVHGEFPIMGFTTRGQPLLRMPTGRVSFGRF